MSTKNGRHETPRGLPAPELFRSAADGGSSAWKRWAAIGSLMGALAGGCIGIALLLLGAIVPAGAAAYGFHVAGTALLLSVIPLILFGSWALDRLEDDLAEREKRLHERAPRMIAGVAVAVCLASAAPARAQQTIFNVPSTDVLDRGHAYFELDATWKPVDPRFSSFVPRIVAGAGGNVEVGLNVLGNVQPGVDATTLVPAVKWKLYDGGDSGWAVVAGDNLYVPVRNRAYDVGNYVYAEVSKIFNATGTRITAGGYHFSDDVVAPGAERAGGQFGVEQPVGSRVSVNADWFTGRHASGYFTPGVAFKLHRRVTGYAAYSIGNTGVSAGNHFFYTAVGINF